MSILGTIGGIFKSALRLGKIIVPALRALRVLSPEIDRGFEVVDEIVERGGIEANDFFDRNMPALREARNYCSEGIVALGEIVEMIDDVERFSQVETPDTITPEEAEALGARVLALKDKIAALVNGSEELEKKLESMA